MNRSYKVLVAVVLALALSLSFATAFAKSGNGHPDKQSGTAIESIALTLSDRQGNTISPDATTEYTVVAGHRYLAKAVITPTAAKPGLRWRSSRPSVVSVNSKGALYCNKPGKAVIIVSAKKGTAKQSIVLNVSANAAAFETTADKTVKRIYLKGSSLMMDVVLINPDAEAAMTAAPDLAFFLKLSGESDYTSLGTKSGHLRRAIAAGGTGIAVYRIKRVDPKTISLPNASAYWQLP